MAIAYLDKTITIERDKHRLYEPMHTLVTSMAALIMASYLVIRGRTVFTINEYGSHGLPRGEVTRLGSKQFDVEVHLPISGPVEAFVRGIYPPFIEITFAPKKPINQRNASAAPPSGGGIVSATAPMRLITSSQTFNKGSMLFITPLFVEFYENYSPFIKRRFGGGAYSWSMIWNFGRVIRNAISHRGAVSFENTNAATVRWEHITYSPLHNGKLIFGYELFMGDMLILMFEMNDELDRQGCPI